MPWFVVDDSAHSHPKFIKAGNAAVGLWMRCGSYAAQHLTDGIVPGVIAKMYGSKPQITKLLTAGLWHEHGHTCSHPKCAQPQPGDYYIHDYLAPYNPSRAEVERKRKQAAEKKRRQRAGAQPEPPDPTQNGSRFARESSKNRERIDDESHTNRKPVFEEAPAHSDVSLGDSPVTRARAFPSPPLPSKEQGADVGGETTGSRARATERPDGLTAPAPIDTDGFHLTDGMRRWAHRDGYAQLIDIDHSTAQFVSHYRSTGARRKSWPDAWQKWIRKDAKDAADRTSRPQQGAFLVPLPGGGQTPARRSTTDERVAQGLAIAAELRALENGDTA